MRLLLAISLKIFLAILIYFWLFKVISYLVTFSYSKLSLFIFGYYKLFHPMILLTILSYSMLLLVIMNYFIPCYFWQF
jgi:hypothetical protein